MGARDSKLLGQVLTYEDAVKRVSGTEFKRLKDAFSKHSTSGGLQQAVFFSDILGETVPSTLAELMYQAWGGTSKGIGFKELLCGLVLLTGGTQEEKCKFIFGLYAKDVNGVINRDDMIDYTVKYAGSWSMEHVAHLFDEGDSVNYVKFRAWLTEYPNATPLTQWLLSDPSPVTLSNDLETPTFYQTLSGVTHLDEQEIIDLEKKYWQLKSPSVNGKFDVQLFASITSAPFSSASASDDDLSLDVEGGDEFTVARGLFSAFDENCDGHLDFKEMVCGISAACRGPLVERIKFCFKIFDFDRDGVLDVIELARFVDILTRLESQEASANSAASAASATSNGSSLSSVLTSNGKDSVNLETFLVWAIDGNRLKTLLELLHQLCHVMLGLRPASRIEEGRLVLSWIRREQKRGLRIGDFWYLVASAWWKQWLDYVLNQEEPQSKQSMGSLKHSGSGDSGSDTSVIVRPGAIDNTCLVAPTSLKVTVLTGEGGRLRKDLDRSKDYEVLPEALWKALSSWYGGSPALPRQAVQMVGKEDVQLELYPLLLRLLRHSTPSTETANGWNGHATSWNSIVGGYGAAALSGGYGYFSTNVSQTPRRYVAYVAAFSQLASVNQTYEYLCGRLRLKSDDVRLWHIKDDNLTLLEDEEATLASLGFRDNDQLLIEVRNKDLTWPEEMVSISGQSGDKYRQALPTEKGATGLNNLGNTCFMNAALQCVSNTQALTQYFAANMHLLELNRDNPLGMKGNIAKDYGDLVRDIWKGKSRTIAPLRLRWTIGKYAPRFNGYQQHDAQELLAFLLDGLHEDLNRVHDKPYVELSDSEGRSDVVVAQEAWENHLLRNRSIIVELFHGQLKSKVTCGVCHRESVRFDPFNYLSLPLPLESYVHTEVTVIRLDGSTPIKYGLRLPMDATFNTLKERLFPLCHVPANHLLIAEVSGAMIKSFPLGGSKVRATSGLSLFAYQVLSSSQSIQLPGSHASSDGVAAVQAPDDVAENASAGHHGKGGGFGDAGRAAKVFQMKGVGHGLGSNAENEATANTATSTNTSTAANEDELSGGDRTSLAGSTASQSSAGNDMSSSSTPPVNGGIVPEISASPNPSAEASDPSFLIAYHRKMIRQDLYFVSPHKTRPSLFGLPLLAPLTRHTDAATGKSGVQTTCQDLYRCIWTLVSRLVSPSPPTDNAALPNHAHDCDDSLGYEFPFTLKVVQANGIHCGVCPWTRFCKGCPIPPTPTPLPLAPAPASAGADRPASLNYCVAIDWEPTALHLRYQASLEKVFDEDASVAQALQQQTEPVSLEQCLQAFTREEQLAGDEKYYCTKCATHQPATKKLQIWRLPPLLIVHLKRFQFVNHRWIKSHKAVHFPLKNLDLTDYLAAVPRQTLLRHRELSNGVRTDAEVRDADVSDDETPADDGSQANGSLLTPPSTDSNRRRLESTSLTTTPVRDEELLDFHQHRLLPGYSKLDITYSLYAAVCHSGIMGGGHYISYAKNPNGKWLYYNDSTCKEAGANQIEGQTAYMLFFERDAIDMKAYLPKIREPSVSSAESAATSSSDSSALSSNQQPSATTVSTGAVPPAAVVPGAASDEDEAGKKCVIM